MLPSHPLPLAVAELEWESPTTSSVRHVSSGRVYPASAPPPAFIRWLGDRLFQYVFPLVGPKFTPRVTGMLVEVSMTCPHVVINMLTSPEELRTQVALCLSMVKHSACRLSLCPSITSPSTKHAGL
eukprot:Rhum_TRINITY_DN15470_c7_g12::Rhum_TRINITY_DN15470_c7_g12_i2::g.158712::m.158712